MDVKRDRDELKIYNKITLGREKLKRYFKNKNILITGHTALASFPLT